MTEPDRYPPAMDAALRDHLQRQPESNLARIVARDGDRCGLCLDRVRLVEASVDHIVPRSHQGGSEIENLRLAHKQCNSRRGTDDCPECESNPAHRRLFSSGARPKRADAWHGRVVAARGVHAAAAAVHAELMGGGVPRLRRLWPHVSDETLAKAQAAVVPPPVKARRRRPVLVVAAGVPPAVAVALAEHVPADRVPRLREAWRDVSEETLAKAQRGVSVTITGRGRK